MSSRVIVKNLPGKATEKRLRELFSSCGEVTDVKLMKTKKGTFRKFGFIGFSSEDQAENAMDRFHKTFIDTSKVEVELAKPYQDPQLARPWSKYSKGSSAHSKHEKVSNKKKGREDEIETGKEAEKPSSGFVQKLEECDKLEEDPDFQEFLGLHKHSSHVQTWRDQAVAHENTQPVDSDEDDGQDVDIVDEEDPAINVEKSDMEYLKSKMMMSDSGTESESGLESESELDTNPEEEMDDSHPPESTRLASTPYTLKMLGLPFKATEKDINDFFHPLKVVSVRFTVDPEGRPSGRAYVDFETKADLKEGLKRHKDCIGRRYIELFEDMGPEEGRRERGRLGEKPRPWEMRGTSDSETESIAESGRVFIRNLSYTTTEESLTKLFESHGPLTEVTVHLDKKTNKPTGIAFVTFMLPEHAVKAFEALDGQIFQGRLLHILPAKNKRSSNESTPSQQAGSSFKKKKEQMMKVESGVGHNWNTLFLGANAVVDAMAERYSADKSSILDPSSQGSAAVRMALGETQLISETREFLESHGVKLELFEQNKPKRSKTVILVKNMAFGTTESELHSLFSPFGTLRQVVLPPSGISALVEFTDPSHARMAFKKLAYTNFKHLPLYLEWAPVGIIGTPSPGISADSALNEEPVGDSEQATVFVKNLNFSTSESSLKELFSKAGNVVSVSIAMKHGVGGSSAHSLSMGYGFVEFKNHRHALKAIKTLQHSELDGHRLELKLSHREAQHSTHSRKSAKLTKQLSAKILVRNVPFEASKKEIKELFRTFGELKSVRLPQKFSVSQGDHRGFAFVEFLTKEDAKRAFDSLSHSTHLYGRRLVLEWAEQEESVEAIRKRTAEHFHGFKVPSAKKKRTESQLLQNTLDNT